MEIKMEIEYKGKQVRITSKETWAYDNISCMDVKKLNTDLFADIQSEVENYLDNKEKIDAEIKEKQIEVQYQKDVEAREIFKKDIEDNYFEYYKNVKIEFPAVFKRHNTFDKYNAKQFTLTLAGTSYDVRIKYDNSVYIGSCGTKSNTNKVWLTTFDYKDIRYVDLKQAIVKNVERLKQSVADIKTKEDIENKKEFAESTMKKFAEDNDFIFEKEYHRKNYGIGRYYYTYSMKKDNVTANIIYNEETKTVKITSYNVKKDNITLEEIKRLI